MKIIKYLSIILAIAGMFYAKAKIDARNKANIQEIESIDETGIPAKNIKK